MRYFLQMPQQVPRLCQRFGSESLTALGMTTLNTQIYLSSRPKLVIRKRGSTSEWRDLLVGLITMTDIPILREIFPRRVLPLNQPDFLRPVPTLELLLTPDGFQHIVE